MKKAILKLYVAKKLRPLFVADIYDDIEATINDLLNQLNDRSKFVITFGNLTFRREDFRLLKIFYK